MGLTLGSPFADGAVIPRERPVPVWGVAEPVSRVSVSFAGQKVETTAGKDGAWRVTLKPMAASCEGRTMMVTAGKETKTLSDLLVGEVWLCSGQSNMSQPLGYGPGWNDVNGVIEAKLTDEPTIRYAGIWGHSYKAPHAFSANTNLVWKKFCGSDNLWNFSAVAYHFAINVRRGLKDVPIGLLWASYGGMPITSFMSAESFAAIPELRTCGYAKCLGSIVDESDPACKNLRNRGISQPTVLFNSMIAPLAGYPVRGVLWFQGECNINSSDMYRLYLHGLAAGWRKAFDDDKLDFLIVRLAPHLYTNASTENALPNLWAAQDRFAEEDPHAATVVIDDSGHPNEVHSPYKRNVGLRLAVCALARHYGRKDLEYRSPRLKWAKQGEGGRVDLAFDHAPGGLYSVNAIKRTLGLKNFELAGADGVWHDAEGRLTNNAVYVRSPEVPNPKKVRYMWKKGAVGDLYCRVSNLMPGAFCSCVIPKDEADVGFVMVEWSEKDGEQWTVYGMADREAKRPMTKDTVFSICSNTKPFTSVLVLTLVQDGLINLDDPVSKYFPEFADIKIKKTGQPPKNPVRLRHLISHLSGIAAFALTDKGMKQDRMAYVDQVRLAVKVGLSCEPGTEYHYSNAGFSVMGAIIEKVTGRKTADLLQERIFDPLGMKDATFYPDAKMLARAAIPYYYPPKGGAPLRYEFSNLLTVPLDDRTRTPVMASGIMCPVGDYLKFAQMVARRGVGVNGRRILAEATCNEILFKRQTPPGDKKDASFDLEFFDASHTSGGKGGLLATWAECNWSNRTCKVVFMAKSPYAPKGVKAELDATGFGGKATSFAVAEVKVGKDAVSCTVRNNEDRHGVGVIHLFVNGRDVASQRLGLAIGESRRISFVYACKANDKVEVKSITTKGNGK